MWRVSTAPTATAGRRGLNWKKFSLSMRSVSQYSRAAFDLPIARATSSPANPPPRIRSRFFCIGREYHAARGPGAARTAGSSVSGAFHRAHLNRGDGLRAVAPLAHDLDL